MKEPNPFEYNQIKNNIMAKKTLPEKVFKPEPVKAKKLKEVITPEPPTADKFQAIDRGDAPGWPKQILPVATPSDFLTSKGFQQVHEGQRISATFEEVHQLLKEYREL